MKFYKAIFKHEPSSTRHILQFALLNPGGQEELEETAWIGLHHRFDSLRFPSTFAGECVLESIQPDHERGMNGSRRNADV